jgi:CHAT domain-containing protein
MPWRTGPPFVLVAALAAGLVWPHAVAASDPARVAARLLAAAPAHAHRLVDDASLTTAPVVDALLDAGDAARADAAFTRALASYALAERAARRTGDDRRLGRALAGAGDVLFRQGDLTRADAAAIESAELYARLGDPAGQAEAWNVRANVLWARGRIEEALGVALRVLDLWTASGDRRGMARSFNNLGNTHRGLGQFTEAEPLYQRALALFEELGDRRRAAVVLDNMGILHMHRGDFPQARDLIERGLAIRREVGDAYGIAKGLDSLGHAYRAQGAYRRALDAFQQAWRARTKLGDRPGVIDSVTNIGLVHFSQGDYAAAIDFFRRGLRLNGPDGSQSLVSESLFAIGAAAWRLGDARRAEANLYASLRIAEAENYRSLAPAIRQELGRIALERGRTDAAARLLRRALTEREQIADHDGIAETLVATADLRLRLGDSRAALEHAQRAALVAERYDQVETLWQAHTLAGIALRRLAQPDRARRALHDAIDVVERLRQEVVPLPERRQQFFATVLSPYHELVALEAADGAAVAALQVAERSRARTLADATRQAPRAIAPPTREAAAIERQRTELMSLNQQLREARSRTQSDAGRIEALLSRRQEARARLADAQTAIAAQVGAGAATTRGLTIAQVAALVPGEDGAVLEYVVTADTAFLLVVTRSGTTARVDARRLPASLAALRAAAETLRSSIAARDLTAKAAARDLYRLVLAPAPAEVRAARHLVIVPDGFLWHVPFHALVDEQGRALIETAVVSYAPSLVSLDARAAQPRAADAPRLLAMGVAGEGREAIPEAEQQVHAIAAIYGAGRSTALVGREATEARFRRDAPLHSVVHLAAHGVLDERAPLYSHLVVAPDAGDDGLLEAWEMQTVRLDADLVVLAACETARGRIAPGEGVIGPMWALLAAGTRALVVSQWRVEARSTAALMTGLHRGLAARRPAAEALRDASLAVMRTPGRAHPYYWAGFMLVGRAH